MTAYTTHLQGNAKKLYERIAKRASTNPKVDKILFVINTGHLGERECEAMADISEESLDALLADLQDNEPQEIARYLRTSYQWVPMKVLQRVAKLATARRKGIVGPFAFCGCMCPPTDVQRGT